MAVTNSTAFMEGPGQPVILQMLLTTALGDVIDIRAQMVSLKIYEDIFAPVLSGEITVLDNICLFDHLPISGNETISIQFYSYGYSPQNDPLNFIHRTFDVLKVTNTTLPNDYSKRYTMVFASPELKLNESIKISKSWPEATISTVVASIMTGSSAPPAPGGTNNGAQGLGFSTNTNPNPPVRSPLLTAADIEANYFVNTTPNAVELFVEKTKNKEPYITVPYMKPFEIIKWLSTRALRNSGGRYPNTTCANFMFFENKRGFQFTSLSTLLENKLNDISIFYWGDATQNLTNPWQLDRIESIRIEDCYDILQNINSGVYASRLYTYEISTGLIVEQDFDYLTQFPMNESVDRASSTGATDYPTLKVDASGLNTLTQQSLSKRMIVPVAHIRQADNISAGSSARFNYAAAQVGAEQYLQARMSQLAKLTDFRITVVIPGQSKHKVGDIIQLNLEMWGFNTPQTAGSGISLNQTNITSKPHKYYSGNYLITAITHIVTNTEYKMQIELAKDSLLAKIG